MAEHFHVAVDRQLVHRPIGLKTLLGHARTADAVVGNIGGQLCVQPLEQQRGQQIAGRLACHHADAARRRGPLGLIGQRTMPRLVAAMKSANAVSTSRVGASSAWATCAAISALA